MTIPTEDALRNAQNFQRSGREEELNRELRELREKVEQAVVCVNTALYVLLKNIDRADPPVN